MVVNSRDLSVSEQKQNADSIARHMRGTSRISRRRRSKRWWAKKFLKQSFSACIRFRYVLLLMVFMFIFISHKNEVLAPEYSSARWIAPSGVVGNAGNSVNADPALPYAAIATSESAIGVPASGQLAIETESLADPMQNGTAPSVSQTPVEADNAES